MIKIKKDGTYVITRNGYPYHVIPSDEPLYTDTKNKVAKKLEPFEDYTEPILPPMPEKTKEQKLAEIDAKSLPHIRAILAKKGTKADEDALAALEAEAVKIKNAK